MGRSSVPLSIVFIIIYGVVYTIMNDNNKSSTSIIQTNTDMIYIDNKSRKIKKKNNNKKKGEIPLDDPSKAEDLIIRKERRRMIL